MKVAWHENYCLPLPEGHRFPMEKYSLLPRQLMYEGTITEDDLFTPVPAQKEAVLAAHCEDYWNKLQNLSLDRKEIRATGFPLTKELIDREITIVGGTMMCVDHALEDGVAFNSAGGTHHAFTDRGEGFCILNDIAVSSLYALQNPRINQVLVVDLDVHQGNGTAEILAGNEQVYTLSVHGAKNYPARKETSDMDVPIEDNTNDETYLGLIHKLVPELIDQVKPDLIHYQCGVDVLETDKLGRLGMSLEGCKERDRIVLEECHKRGIPVVCTMGGGYSKDIRIIIEAHANTYRLARDFWG